MNKKINWNEREVIKFTNWLMITSSEEPEILDQTPLKVMYRYIKETYES